jgi:alginate O-acetyltransferase complex protein AlgI
MTLGAWMRSYLYIPLGGNRVKSKFRLYLNLWLVFLASGLWHGAAWGFVIWGAYHGIFLVLERAFLGRWLEKMGRFSVLYTFPVILIGWVCFRLEHLHPSLQYLGRMLSWHPSSEPWHPAPDYYFFLCLAFLFSFFTLLPGGKRMQFGVFHGDYSIPRHACMAFASVVLLVVCAGRITIADFNPFIYFRF